MKIRRLFIFIIGVLVIAAGFYCLFNPEMTYMTLGYVVGVTMFLDSFAQIGIWWQLRKIDKATIWMLLTGILSAVCGVIIITDSAAQQTVDMFIAYFAAFWILARGIFSIIIAFKFRKLHKDLNTQYLGSRWWLTLLTGILNIAFAILSMLNPTYIMTYIGLFIGLGIISTGLDIVSAY